MQKVLMSVMAAACLAAPMAQANTGHERLIACYQKVTVAAVYDVNKVLIKKPERKYIKRNGRIELVEYPAIYREDRKLKRPEQVVMQEIPCK